MALMLAWVYLLLPAVQTNAAWDVHGASFLPPLLHGAPTSPTGTCSNVVGPSS